MRLELDSVGQVIDLVYASCGVEYWVAGLALSLLRKLLVLSSIVGVACVVVEALIEDWTSSCCGKMSSNGSFLKGMRRWILLGSRLEDGQLYRL